MLSRVSYIAEMGSFQIWCCRRNGSLSVLQFVFWFVSLVRLSVCNACLCNTASLYSLHTCTASLCIMRTVQSVYNVYFIHAVYIKGMPIQPFCISLVIYYAASPYLCTFSIRLCHADSFFSSCTSRSDLVTPTKLVCAVADPFPVCRS